MKSRLIVLLGCCYLAISTEQAFAQTNNNWKEWIDVQIKQHPRVISALEELKASRSTIKGASQPIYNPELETELEKEGDENNYRLGFKQTIDFNDRRDGYVNQAKFYSFETEKKYQSLIETQTFETLKAIVNRNVDLKKSLIVQKQELLISRLIEVFQSRKNTGDLAYIDAQLAFMALSNRLKSSADVFAELRRSEALLATQLPDWKKNLPLLTVPQSFWQRNSDVNPELRSRSHPDVMAYEMRWKALRSEVDLAMKKQHADPTFGINVGRQNNEDSVGLTFSIPLNIRNNFSSEVKAASEIALSAEESFKAEYLEKLQLIIGSEKVLFEYEKRYLHWQSIAKMALVDADTLLEKQWKSGDISTTDYIQLLNQLSDGQMAGIELEQKWKLSYIELLLNEGSISNAISNL